MGGFDGMMPKPIDMKRLAVCLGGALDEGSRALGVYDRNYFELGGWFPRQQPHQQQQPGPQPGLEVEQQQQAIAQASEIQQLEQQHQHQQQVHQQPPLGEVILASDQVGARPTEPAEVSQPKTPKTPIAGFVFDPLSHVAEDQLGTQTNIQNTPAPEPTTPAASFEVGLSPVSNVDAAAVTPTAAQEGQRESPRPEEEL